MLLFKKTIPTPGHVKERYQSDLHAENYIKFRANDNANYRYLASYMDMVADLVFARNPGRVLDLGCGSGPIVQGLEKRLPQAELVGLDISRQLLKAVLPIAAVQGDAFALPFKDASFDITVCVAVSELFSDDHFVKVLQEARRVTRAGGCLVIQYRNPYSFWEPYWWLNKYSFYQNAYTRSKLHRISKKMSLPIEHLQGNYLAAPPLIYRNHQAFYRDWMPEPVLELIRRLDIGFLSRLFPFLCRHFIVVHRVAGREEPSCDYGEADES